MSDGNRDQLVEHLLIGAMGADAALSYFRRRPTRRCSPAAIGSDLQIAALETSTAA